MFGHRLPKEIKLDGFLFAAKMAYNESPLNRSTSDNKAYRRAHALELSTFSEMHIEYSPMVVIRSSIRLHEFQLVLDLNLHTFR